MDAVLQELKALRQDVQQIQQDRMDQDLVPEEIISAESQGIDKVDWSELLIQELAQPSKPEALELCHVLGFPPPFDSMKHLAKTQIKYSGIPATPSQRPQHRLDATLQMPQQKMELAMHSLTHYVETNDKQALLHTAAWIRSAWEDLHQQRRHTLAGKQSYKLEKRADDNRPKLLSPEEESKIIITKPRQQPRPARYWGDTTSGDQKRVNYASKYPPKNSGNPGKGKGKGKGKGGKSL